MIYIAEYVIAEMFIMEINKGKAVKQSNWPVMLR